MEIEQVNIVDIQPYENNPRKNEKAVDVVAKSIKEFGFLVPIILDDKNYIVAGHTRVKAAIKLGMDNVPAIYTEGLTQEQIDAFRIMDNKSAEYAVWDPRLLYQELKKLEEKVDLSITGFTENELNKILGSDTKEEPVPEGVKYDIHIEDLYELENNGLKHYVLCGDATNKQDVETLMNGQKADMVFTDPPYNVDYSGGRQQLKGKTQHNKQIINDNLSITEFSKFLEEVYKNINLITTEDACIYVFHGDSKLQPLLVFLNAWDKIGWHHANEIIWNKNMSSLGFGDYRYIHECATYGWKGKNHYSAGDRTQTDVWDISKDNHNSYIHPTQKPIELSMKAIQNSSKKDNIVLDLFGGSGSTLIACEQTGRNCYMMELDEDYCSKIIERWENLTGKTAKKLGGQ